MKNTPPTELFSSRDLSQLYAVARPETDDVARRCGCGRVRLAVVSVFVSFVVLLSCCVAADRYSIVNVQLPAFGIKTGRLRKHYEDYDDWRGQSWLSTVARSAFGTTRDSLLERAHKPFTVCQTARFLRTLRAVTGTLLPHASSPKKLAIASPSPAGEIA